MSILKRVGLIFDRTSGRRVEGEVRDSLRTAGRQGGQELKKELDVAGKKSGESFGNSFVTAFKRLAAPLLGLFAFHQFGRLAKSIFEVGTAVEETASKFRTTFGAASESVEAFIEEWANLAGLQKTNAKDFAAISGAITQGMGASKQASAEMSEQILRLAGDLQSFHNVPIEETFNAIRSGLVGESEPMRRFGVVILQADVNLKALAMTGKRAATDLTQLEKATAALALMQEKAGVATGDLDRTQDSLANRARRLRAEFADMREEIALALLPAWEKLVTAADEGNWIEKAGRAANFFVDHLGEILRVVKLLTAALVLNGLVSGISAATRAWRTFVATSALVSFLQVAVSVRSLADAMVVLRWAVQGLWASLGPAGWLVLGLTGLIALYQRVTRAQKEATQANIDYSESLKDMDLDQINKELVKVGLEILNLEDRIANFAGGDAQAMGRLIQQLEAKKKLAEEITKIWRDLTPAVDPPPIIDPNPSAKDREAAEERIRKLWEHLGIWMTENAREMSLGANPAIKLNLTAEGLDSFRKAEEERKRFMGLGGSLDMVTPKGPLEEMSDGEIAALQREIDMLEQLGVTGDRVAYGISSSFENAFTLMRGEAATVGKFVGAVLRGIAGAGLSSIAQLAQQKVKENVAMALEAGARALGFLAIGNFPSQSAALASAAQHGIAALAWGALAGGAGAAAGAVTGGQGAISGGGRDTGIGVARTNQPSPTQVHVYWDPLDPNDRRVQVFHAATAQNVKEQFPDGAVVQYHDYPRKTA